jgi:hypothetical protein
MKPTSTKALTTACQDARQALVALDPIDDPCVQQLVDNAERSIETALDAEHLDTEVPF